VSYNRQVIGAAVAVTDAIRADLMSRLGTQAAVVAAAPAGAGKSHFVSETVGQLRANGTTVVAATPTNEQAHDLVRQIVGLNPGIDVTLMPAHERGMLDEEARRLGVTQLGAREVVHAGAPLVVATLDKVADAATRYGFGGYGVLVIDEAYQADAARYYAAAGVADTHLPVGDSGQLDPFSSLDDATFWRGGPEDPLQTAVGILLRNHPDTPVHQLPLSRRLDPRAVPVARAFYPGHHFDAAVLPGVRRLVLQAPGAGRRRLAAFDRALDEAAHSGWAHVTLPGTSVLTADPETAETITSLADRLLTRGPEIRDELNRSPRSLTELDIAVGVSHTDQRDRVRVMLDDAGRPDVVVDTANRLQGRQFQVVLVWHPLAGQPSTDAFHLDPGRMCVLLTRHRHACIVVGRGSDRALLDGIPPATPGYLGWEPDPVLDGWDAHERVFDELDPHCIPV
jgi:hypothetical protein